MKLTWILFVFLFTLKALAQPINYQGKLSDKSGSPVNGTKNFSLKIFDDKTGGNQIYEEAIGQTAVKEGLYSFNFGETGKSVSTATETIGFADGEKQIFNYTVKNKPVLGEIKISGGGYSWTEAGSSDATKFTATANKNSGAISAIYLTGAPEAGGQISISYTHGTDGITGALSRGGQAWLELTVDGEALSPRERLVAVPFALRAAISESTKNLPDDVIHIDRIRRNYTNGITRGTSYYFSPNSRNAIKLILYMNFGKKRQDQPQRNPKITLFVKKLDETIVAQKIFIADLPVRKELVITLEDIPPAGLCDVL